MGIRSDLNKMAEPNKDITKHYDQLGKRVSVGESNLAIIGESSVDSNIIVSEINKHKRNETEVVAFNIPESDKPVGVDRLWDDHKKLTALILPELLAKLPDFKLRRLGHSAVSKNCPLLIKTWDYDR